MLSIKKGLRVIDPACEGIIGVLFAADWCSPLTLVPVWKIWVRSSRKEKKKSEKCIFHEEPFCKECLIFSYSLFVLNVSLFIWSWHLFFAKCLFFAIGLFFVKCYYFVISYHLFSPILFTVICVYTEARWIWGWVSQGLALQSPLPTTLRIESVSWKRTPSLQAC